MAAEGDYRLLPIPRRAGELASAKSLPLAAALGVVACAIAPRAAPPGSARPTQPAGGPMDSSSSCSASLSYGVLRRQSSKVEAVCVSRARTVLCGGCRATGIPTATASHFLTNCLSRVVHAESFLAPLSRAVWPLSRRSARL